MQDDQAGRVRELLVKINEWSAEYEDSLEKQRRSQRALQETLRATARVAVIAAVPGAIWIVTWCRANAVEHKSSLWNQLVSTFVMVTLFSLVSIAVARASSLFSHWWFQGMRVHERRAAKMMTLVAEIVIFGWVMVVLS